MNNKLNNTPYNWNNLKYFKQHWVINDDILQHSVYAITNFSRNFSMEAFVFSMSKKFQELSCVAWLPNDKRYVTSVPYRIINILDSLYKVFCEFSHFEVNIDSVFYAAIVKKEYLSRNKKINFQKVMMINKLKQKIKSVAHCVHGFRNTGGIDSTRTKNLENWLLIQKNIGINEVRIDVLNANDSLINYLLHKYKTYLTIVDHRIDFNSFCQSNDNQTQCKYFYETIILNLGYNERVNVNDCYLNFKYKYEMVTNYDVDEIIFPRSIKMNELIKYDFKSLDCESYHKKFKISYNIYDYATQLFNMMGNNSAACLMFKNVMFAFNDKNFEDFILKTESLVSNANTTNYLIAYESVFNKSMKIGMKNDQLDQFRLLSNLSRISKCKIKSNFNQFNRIFAFLSEIQYGKSILRTSVVETINQHSSDEMSNGYSKKEAPLTHGFSSHFREHYEYFIKDSFFHEIVFDIEFFSFFLNLLNQ